MRLELNEQEALCILEALGALRAEEARALIVRIVTRMEVEARSKESLDALLSQDRL